MRIRTCKISKKKPNLQILCIESLKNDRYFRINNHILSTKGRLSASFKQLQKILVLQTIATGYALLPTSWTVMDCHGLSWLIKVYRGGQLFVSFT